MLCFDRLDCVRVGIGSAAFLPFFDLPVFASVGDLDDLPFAPLTADFFSAVLAEAFLAFSSSVFFQGFTALLFFGSSAGATRRPREVSETSGSGSGKLGRNCNPSGVVGVGTATSAG